MTVRGFAIAALLLLARQARTSEIVQPLPFSHQTHSSVLKCADCHPNPDPGAAMTIPAAAKCMACHTTIAKDRESIQKLAEFSRTGRPIPWVRVYSVPAWIFWSHRPHLKARLPCDACHGDVARMEKISLATNAIKMSGCVDCHRQKKATVECSACHDLNR